MPSIKVASDDLFIYFLDDDPFWETLDIEVTDEEKIWIERGMKKFWAVQDFLIGKTRNGQN